ATIKSERSPDIGGGRGATPVAHGRVIDENSAICSRTSQGETKRTGDRRFRKPRIRRAVTACVAADRTQTCAHGGARRQPGRGDEEESCQARGWQIHEIVEPCRGPAERRKSIAAVTEHAVSGVDRLVANSGAEPAQRGPENRGNHPVGKI